jgi:hypothetical protein
MVLESPSVVISVGKPGNLANRTLTLIIEAQGEANFSAAFDVTMTRLEASSGVVIAANRSIRIDQPSISAFGQHVEWKQLPPPATWLADLDGSRFKYAHTSRHEFTVRLACDTGEQNCAADGDVIETFVQLASPGQGHRLKSQEVMVQTRVQSLVSCDNSRA